MHSSRRSRGVTTIAVVNAVAGVVTLLFWGLVYLRLFAGPTNPDPVLRASAAATLGFLVGDVVWAVPLLFLSVAGLWRLRDWGWLVARATVGPSSRSPCGVSPSLNLRLN